jgi:phosphate transport system substrate-binding protein
VTIESPSRIDKPHQPLRVVKRDEERNIRMSTEPSSIQRGARKGKISRTTVIVAVVLVFAIAGGTVAYLVWPRATIEFVRIDGSSTVAPITTAWAGGFNNPSRQVEVAFSGTGGGFAKFCLDETDLSDASRPMRQSELDICVTNGITDITDIATFREEFEFLVAYDGLSVVVNIDNTWVDHLSVADLCRIWTSNPSAGACGGAGGHAAQWRDLRPADTSWPTQNIDLWGPGTASGTYDYFKEVILDPTDDPITADFTPNEDDNRLVQGVASSLYTLGYFGYAYAIENTDTIRIVPIDGGDGPVMPSSDTVRDLSYTPLSRPLYIYAKASSLARPVVQDFLEFGLSDAGTELVDLTGYVSLTAAERSEQLLKVP